MNSDLHARRSMLVRLAALAAGTVVTNSARSQQSGDDGTAAPSDIPQTEKQETVTEEIPQPGMPTLGGMQFWGDLGYFRGYKIQRNVFSGHYRLLDANDRRYVSGSIQDCKDTLDKLKKVHGLKADTGHAVICLHGIGRSSKSLRPIISALPKDQFTAIGFEYPSTRVPLAQSAEFLHSVIESLTDVGKISFVVHSMGGLVVRAYLKEHRDPRLHRMVMMGTPNNGAELASMLKTSFFYRTIYGPAGQELATDPAGTISSLPVPDFEFGIVAGGKGDDFGYNRLLPGDNDGTVTVASAHLTGAADFLRVPKLHSFLMSDETVIAAVRNFLDHGQFPH